MFNGSLLSCSLRFFTVCFVSKSFLMLLINEVLHFKFMGASVFEVLDDSIEA